MEPIFHVQDRPYFVLLLVLENVFNPGEGAAFCDCDLIQFPIIHHKPVFPGLFFCHREGWAGPGTGAPFYFATGYDVINHFLRASSLSPVIW